MNMTLERAEAAKFVRDRAAETIEWIARDITRDELLDARWMARIAGHAFALSRKLTQTYDFDDEEFRYVLDEWLECIVYGLMDNGVIEDDREKAGAGV